MVLRLYYDAMSQPSRALLIFLRANSKQIPFEEVPVALRKGEHMTEKFAAINPFKKVPVIDHDGFMLTESVSILRYLCRAFPVSETWYPRDLKLQARVDEYMAWQHLNMRAFGSLVFRTKIIVPAMTGNPVDEKQLASYAKSLGGVLDQIEQVWLKDKSFMAGQDLTIADLLATTELEQPGMAGYDVLEGRPKLKAYMDRVKGLLQPHYDDAHAVVYKVKAKATPIKPKL